MPEIHRGADDVLVIGGMNTRIGDSVSPDVIDKADRIPERKKSDNVKHGHYKSILEFINDSKFGVLKKQLSYIARKAIHAVSVEALLLYT